MREVSENHARLLVAPWTVARQAPLSLGFSRPESWSGLPRPSPGDLPHRGIKPEPPTLAGGLLTAEPPGKPSLFNALGFPVHRDLCAHRHILGASRYDDTKDNLSVRAHVKSKGLGGGGLGCGH